jgi:hypothetical protein
MVTWVFCESCGAIDPDMGWFEHIESTESAQAKPVAE